MRFQYLTAVSMKMAVFWVVVPCSLVEVFQTFNVAQTRVFAHKLLQYLYYIS
jgi:hypothetical protein